MQIDGYGIQGMVLHYGLIAFLVGSALLLFLYLWYKGRLDMDDEPANQMIKMSEDHPEEDNEEKVDEHAPK